MARKGARGGRGVGTTTDHLTPLMEAFCVSYVQQEGRAAGADAVAAAGSLARADGSPGNPASVQATRWLKMPKIQARIQALRDAAAAPILPQLRGKILSEHERKVRLSALAERYGPWNPIQAIDVLNKMDKLYSEGGQAPATPSQTFIFNLDGQSVSARELYQRAIAAANSVPMVQDGTCTDAPEG